MPAEDQEVDREGPYDDSGRRFRCLVRDFPLLEKEPTTFQEADQLYVDDLAAVNRNFREELDSTCAVAEKFSDTFNCGRLESICGNYAYTCVGIDADLALNCGLSGLEAVEKIRARADGILTETYERRWLYGLRKLGLDHLGWCDSQFRTVRTSVDEALARFEDIVWNLLSGDPDPIHDATPHGHHIDDALEPQPAHLGTKVVGRPRGVTVDAEKIRSIRRHLGLSQEELHEKAKLSVNTIRRAETGGANLSLPNLAALSAAFTRLGHSVSVGDLIVQ